MLFDRGDLCWSLVFGGANFGRRSVEADTFTSSLDGIFLIGAARGDAAGLVELYEPDAAFEPQIGVVLRTSEAIGEALAGLAAMRPRITYAREPDVVVVGDIALVSNAWTMTAVLPDGSGHREGGVSADVLRRQSDGTWLVLIDQPRGETLAT